MPLALPIPGFCIIGGAGNLACSRLLGGSFGLSASLRTSQTPAESRLQPGFVVAVVRWRLGLGLHARPLLCRTWNATCPCIRAGIMPLAEGPSTPVAAKPAGGV